MANKRYLQITNSGAVFIEVDENGVEVSRTPAATADALNFIVQVIQEPEHFRVRGGGARGDKESLKLIIARKTLEVILLHARDMEQQGETEQRWVDSVRNLLRDPGALSYLKSYAESGIDAQGAATIARIWPQLVDPNVPPVDPNAPADPSATPADTAIAGGSNQGSAPLPESKPGGSGSGKVPPSGRPGSATGTGGGTTPDGARAADPILPASGQLLLEDSDLEVEGIGLDLRFERFYLHNVDYDGPLGPKWDHSYNLWLREAVEKRPNGGFSYVVYRSSGRLTADRFVFEGELAAPEDFRAQSDAVFMPPEGTHERLVKTGGRFTLQSPDGHRIFYNDHLRAERLEDLNGNRIRLLYQQDAFRLSEIEDTCGRLYRLAYDEAGRLVRLLDTAMGRDVAYSYDAQGRLVAVRHSTGDADRPARFKGYRYWGDGAPPGMQNNIVAVVDPRGIEVLQVRYGIEPALPSYNRVVEQRNGTILSIDYDFLFEPGASAIDLPATAPAVRVRMHSRDGGAHEMDYNGQGRMIRHIVFEFGLTGTVAIETRWTHNADGRVLREDRPGGGATEYEYGRERFAALGGDPGSATAAERMRFGDLHKIIERGRPGSTGPPQRITEFDYHPQFGFVVEQRGPYYADHLGQRTDSGPPFAFRAVYDDRANLVRLDYPNCIEADGAIQSGRQVEFERDSRGRLVVRRLPLGGGTVLETAYEYPPDTAPDCAQPAAEVLDPAGLALRRTFIHDSAGRTIGVTESSGQAVTRLFDHLGRVLREEVSPHVPGGAPSRIMTEWAPHDRPLRIVRNRIDAQGVVDPDGRIEQSFTFDAEGEVHVARTFSADGRVDRQSRHVQEGSGQRLVRVEAEGVESHFHYNVRGLLVEQLVTADGTEPTRYLYRYNDEGLLVRLEDSAGRLEEMEYDGFGRMARRAVGGVAIEEYQWDAADRLTTRKLKGAHPDHPGHVLLREERRELNEAGRIRIRRTGLFDPAASSPPQFAETRYFYDRGDRLCRVEGPTGTFREYEYDALGRSTRCRDASGNVESWSYDDNGRSVAHEMIIVAEPPGGPQMQTSFRTVELFDAHGNVVERVDPLGNRFRYEYDSRGCRTAVVDPAGMRREELPEPDGRLRQVTVAKGRPEELSWTYRRDRAGRVTGIDGPRGAIVAIERDARGRTIEVQYGPAGIGSPTRYRYDSVDRIVAATDGRGLAIEYSYNGLGLPASLSFDRSGVSAPAGINGYVISGPAEISLAYDGAGHLVEADDGNLKVSRRYDSRGLLLRETVEGLTVAWSYDLSGLIHSFTYPDGRRLEYVRDAGGQMTGIVETASGPADPGAPPPDGVLLERVPWGLTSALLDRWRGAVEHEDTPDGAGRLLRMTDRRVADDATIAESVQISDARSMPRVRRLSIGSHDRTDIVDVDGQARVVGVKRAASMPLADTSTLEAGVGATQADHDALAATVASGLPSPPPEELLLDLAKDGARKRLRWLAEGAVAEDLAFQADGAGRVAAVGGETRLFDGEGIVVKLGNRRLEHDVSRRLSKVVEDATTLFECVRDALGRPHRLSMNGSTLRLVHDGVRLIETRDGSGPVTQYVRDYNTGFLLETGTGGASFLALRDLSGSVVGAADANGNVVGTRIHDPFGRLEAAAGAGAGPEFGFQSLFAIPGTDFHLTHMRAYDAATGSFLEPDPADFIDGPNRHLAARCNPYIFRDEWGLSAEGPGQTGRGSGTGTHNQRSIGGFWAEDRELRWYERAFLAMAGAVGAVSDMVIVEPAKQVSDMVGLGAAAFGEWTGWYEFDYQVKSGIGHAAEQGMGTIDIFKGMGRNIMDAPGRVWRAAEEGDYYRFGAEAMNLYVIGKSAHGVARGTASWGFNRGVNVLGRLGQTGRALRYHIRTWQANRLASRAMAILGRNGPGPKIQYDPTMPKGDLGQFGLDATGAGVISIGEGAFVPGWRAFWPEGVGGMNPFRIRVGQLLRGNLKLRTMTHEMNHFFQWLDNPTVYNALGPAMPGYSYMLDPFEFTQFQGSPIMGSWNMELRVPAGPYATAAGGASVGNNLVDSEGPRTSTP